MTKGQFGVFQRIQNFAIQRKVYIPMNQPRFPYLRYSSLGIRIPSSNFSSLFFIKAAICVPVAETPSRVFNNSELKGAHFKILPEKVPIFAKNVRFLYYR